MWLNSGGSPGHHGHLHPVSGGLGSENRILRADTEPPLAGFGVYGGSTVLGGHGEVRGVLICIPGESRPCLYGSGPGRVPIARLAEPPVTRTPRRYARHRAKHAPARSRPWGLRAVLPDQNGLWWRPGVRGVAQPPGRGVEPQATNLRVRDSLQLHPLLRARRARPARRPRASRALPKG